MNREAHAPDVPRFEDLMARAEATTEQTEHAYKTQLLAWKAGTHHAKKAIEADLRGPRGAAEPEWARRAEHAVAAFKRTEQELQVVLGWLKRRRLARDDARAYVPKRALRNLRMAFNIRSWPEVSAALQELEGR